MILSDINLFVTIIGGLFTIIAAIYNINKHIIKKKRSKEIKKKKNITDILIQLKSEAISPVSAKLYVEIENRSDFDLHNLKIKLDDFIGKDFFKLPPIFNSEEFKNKKLKELFRKTKNLCSELKSIYILKEKNEELFLYNIGYIEPYKYLLNLYKDIIKSDYLDTINFLDNKNYNIEEEIKSKNDIENFMGFVCWFEMQLSLIETNLRYYFIKTKGKTIFIDNLKEREKKDSFIMHFHFFVFKNNHEDKREVEFSSKKSVDLVCNFEKYENEVLIEKTIKKNVKINRVLKKYDFKNEINNLFNSYHYKDWESSLSEKNLKKMKQIKIKAIDDIYVFMKLDTMEYLGQDFFTEYQDFIKILDSDFKMEQLVIG